VLILPVIFLLGTRNPIRKASAFAIAALVIYMTLGALVLFVLGGQITVIGDGYSKINAIVNLALGILSLLLVAFQSRSRANNEESANKQAQALKDGGTWRAFGLGAIMPLFGAKNLIVYTACLNLIAKEQVGAGNSLLAMFAVLLIFSIQMLVPISIYAIVSERADRALAFIQNWTLKHNRTISLWAGLLAGLFLSRRASPAYCRLVNQLINQKEKQNENLVHFSQRRSCTYPLAWLSELWRAWLDMLFEYPGGVVNAQIDGGSTLAVTLIYTAIFAGWAYTFYLATRGSRGALIATCVFNALVWLAIPVGWVTAYCTGPCAANAGTLFNLAT